MHARVSEVFRESPRLTELATENPRLYQYVLEQCHQVVSVLQEIPDAFGEYTDHGVNHSVAVLELGEQLLADVKLNKWELAIFVLACFYHDVGMACAQEEWTQLEGSEEFQAERELIQNFVLPGAKLVDPNVETIRAQTITEFLRRHHGERGRRWIRENRPSEAEDSMFDHVYLWDSVAHVSVGHTLDSREIERDPTYTRSRPVGSGRSVDLRLLTCLLRLADICHMSRDRALPHRRESMEFSSTFSRRIWEALGDMAGVSCDKRRGVIVVSGELRSFQRHRLIHEEILKIKLELENCHRLLIGDVTLPWKFVDATQVQPASDASYDFVPDGKFRLDESKIINLLMGSRLYSERMYALRECVQNSLDAIKVVQLEQSNFDGCIVLRFSEASGRRVLDIFDNGVGMDQQVVLDHLLAAGSRSFVESERRARDWGSLPADMTFIARHGIGFLSCFMISDEIEVFSLYRGEVPICLRIDSPTRNVEFMRPCERVGLPSWGSSLQGFQTPWEGGHGTCVRLHLAEDVALTAHALLRFIAENLPRVPTSMFVIWDDEVVRIEENWRRSPASELSEDSSLLELGEGFFGIGGDTRSFYEGPPRDPALEILLKEGGNLRGWVRIKTGIGWRTGVGRLSQDGILVRDGGAMVWLFGRDGVEESPFEFDVDVTGSLQLELDAERARLLDTKQNRVRCRAICDWIEAQGLSSLARASSTLYFPCGGTYYLGGASLIEGHDSPSFCFHGPLQTYYTLDRFERSVERYGPAGFCEGKLYLRMGETRCSPASVDDLVQHEGNLAVAFLGGSGGIGSARGVDVPDDYTEDEDRRVSLSLFRKLRAVADPSDVLWVQEISNLFFLPLLLDFEVGERNQLGNSGLIVVNLQPKFNRSVPRQAEVEIAAEVFCK